MSGPLHGPGALPPDFAADVTDWIGRRLEGSPLGRTATPTEMAALLQGVITEHGLGAEAAWQRFVRDVAPNNVGLDSDRFLAFIPVAPSSAGVWMDAVVGAANFSAESWLEAAGAVAAENQALQWLADLLGLPDGSGGCFMSGGSIGNLSALAVAREHCAGRAVAVADTAHASVGNSLRLLGITCVVVVPTGDDGRFTAEALRSELARTGERLGIIVAAGGSTNAGVVDDLDGLADVAAEHDAWLHVDAAYGGAAMLLPEKRALFAGVGRAHSVIVDPHKWLFAPEGSCALLYREPAAAAAVHTQHGPYLDVLHGDEPLWNPSDYGYQLTRRAMGLPLWFALAVHGTQAHAEAVRAGVALARYAASTLAAVPGVSLVMEPELSVVMFRREGWGRAEWGRWARDLLDEGVAFVAPSTWRGEAVGRLVFLHPHTPTTVVDAIADSLRG